MDHTLSLKAGANTQIITVFIRKEADLTPLTGLAFNTSGLTCHYIRANGSAAVAVTLANMTLGSWVSGGFKEISAANMPGYYQFGVPDAAIAAGAAHVAIHFRGAATMADTPLHIDLATRQVDVVEINGGATTGNIATLRLKALEIVNTGGSAIVATSAGNNGHGIMATGNGLGSGITGMASGTGHGMFGLAGSSGHGMHGQSVGTGHGFYGLGGGTSGHGIFAQAPAAGDGIRARGAGAGGLDLNADSSQFGALLRLLARGKTTRWVRPDVGDDGNDGLTFWSAKATLASALAASAAGDTVALVGASTESLIDVPAGVALVGLGVHASRIQPATAPGFGVGYVLRLADRSQLENITVDAAAQGGGAGVTAVHIAAAAARQVRIRGCEIRSTHIGVNVSLAAPDVVEIELADCRVVAGAFPLYAIAGQHRVVARACWFEADVTLAPAGQQSALDIWTVTAADGSRVMIEGCQVLVKHVASGKHCWGLAAKDGGHLLAHNVAVHMVGPDAANRWAAVANTNGAIYLAGDARETWPVLEETGGRVRRQAATEGDEDLLWELWGFHHGRTVHWVDSDGAPNGGADTNVGWPWRKESFATIAKAISVAAFGDIIYLLAGDHTLTADIELPAGVRLEAFDRRRTRIIRTGAGGGSVPIIRMNSGCRAEGFTLVDQTTSGKIGIGRDGTAQADSVVLNHVKVDVKLDGVSLTTTQAGTWILEETFIEAGRRAIHLAGAPHKLWMEDALIQALGSKHPTGNVDVDCVLCEDGAEVFVHDAPMKATQTSASHQARCLRALSAAEANLWQTPLESSHATPDNAKDVSVDGSGTVARLIDALVDRAKLQATSGAQILDALETIRLHAAGLDNVVIESGLNGRQALAVIAAALAGKLSGAGGTSVSIKGAGSETVRIAATVDGVGNRTAITLTPPA